MNTTLYQDLHHQGISVLIIFCIETFWFDDTIFSEEMCQLKGAG